MKKFFRFLKNAALALLLGLYVYAGFSAVGQLLTHSTVRAQDISILPRFIETAAEMKKPEKVAVWIAHRKVEEADKIANIVADKADISTHEAFFALSNLYRRAEKPEQAYNWLQYARYRLRYDALRCGGETGASEISLLVDRLASPDIASYGDENSQRLKKSLRWVMDLDAKKPPRNDPARVCKIVGLLEKRDAYALPPPLWGFIRNNLRVATERAIDEIKP